MQHVLVIEKNRTVDHLLVIISSLQFNAKVIPFLPFPDKSVAAMFSGWVVFPPSSSDVLGGKEIARKRGEEGEKANTMRQLRREAAATTAAAAAAAARGVGAGRGG